MHKDKFKFPLTLEHAMGLIKQNGGVGFEWYPVKTRSKNILEVGGAGKKLKVCVIKMKGKKIDPYFNGFVQDNFSILVEGEDIFLETSSTKTLTKKWKSVESLLKYLNTTRNFNSRVIKEKEVQILVPESRIHLSL